jgi:hypothetical protein
MKWIHRTIRAALALILLAGVLQLTWGALNVLYPVRGGRGEIGGLKLEIAWMNIGFGALWTAIGGIGLGVHAMSRRWNEGP